MAEVKADGKAIAGGLPVPHPQAAIIQAQNAQRVAKRRRAASLALEIQRTTGEDLDRFGDTRQVGGVFEKLQKVPKAKPQKNLGLDFADILQFLQGLSFDPQKQGLAQSSFISSFGPAVLGLAGFEGFQPK